jgi:hypothetical protein
MNELVRGLTQQGGSMAEILGKAARGAAKAASVSVDSIAQTAVMAGKNVSATAVTAGEIVGSCACVAACHVTAAAGVVGEHLGHAWAILLSRLKQLFSENVPSCIEDANRIVQDFLDKYAPQVAEKTAKDLDTFFKTDLAEVVRVVSEKAGQIFNIEALMDFFAQVKKWTEDNEKLTVTILVVSFIVLPMMVTLPLLGALGFSHIGPVAGESSWWL